MIMDPAKTQCEMVHTVSNDGLYFSISITNDAMLWGGRGVKPPASSSGDLTNQGSRTDMANVMMENAINDKLPIRPTWASMSGEDLISTGASYRR